MSEPVFSVVVPVYNGERLLLEALASIVAQAATPIEVIVVDDGSTDRSAQIAREFTGARVVSQDNRGPAAARNLGLRAARGRLVAFLDADDLWCPGTLRTQLSEFADPAVDMVSGRTQCLCLIDGAWRTHGGPRFLPNFGATVVRRAALERVGPMDETLRCGEDIDWFMRARDAGLRMVVHGSVVLQYRLHGGNLTRHVAVSAAGHVTAVRKLLNRRRLTNEGGVSEAERSDV